MSENPILANLNKEQLEAVTTVDGAVMVFAGAGTGKTKTLISRIAYMIDEKNIQPYHILAITFTKKATNEMRERLNKLIGSKAAQVHISTIHSLCAMILRRNCEALDFARNFEIIDEEDQLKVMTEIFKKNNIEKRVLSPRVAIKAIGDYKNKTCNELLGLLNTVYNEYQAYLKEHNLMDFEDLLTYTAKLFNENPEILSFYQNIYQYVLVDELQDTNAVQYEIINLLCENHGNLFAVGDDDQSIYSFRGAKIENMVKFREDHPDAKVTVINSLLNSASFSLFIYQALQMRKAGYSYEDTIKVLEALRNDGRIMFTTESLEYLSKGGRLAKTAITITSKLSLRPIIVMKEGEIGLGGFTRTRNKGKSNVIDMIQKLSLIHI